MSCFKRGHVLVFFLQPLFCPQAAATCTACSAVESWAGVHASLAEDGFSESGGGLSIGLGAVESLRRKFEGTDIGQTQNSASADIGF
jgi:hypothetical protein